MPTSTRFLFARPAAIGLLLVALLPFVGLLFFTHPVIDDFDNAETVARLGYWGAQWYWYTHWSGRFVAIGFSTLLNPLSWAPTQGVAPAGLLGLRSILLLLVAGLAGAMQQFFWACLLVLPVPAGAKQPARGFAWGLALTVLVLALNALPEPFTLLYWYSGALNYVLPLLLALSFATAALRALRLPVGAPGRTRWAAGAAVCLVGAIGGGEITLLTCWVLLIALGLWLRLAPLRESTGSQRMWFGWMVLGLVVAGLMLGAPGNWHRLALAAPDPGAWYHRWVLLAPRSALAAARLAARPPVLGALLVISGAVLLTANGPRGPRPGRRESALMLGAYLLINSLGVAFMKASFMHDVWVEAMPDRVVNVLVIQLLISTVVVALWARSWVPDLAVRVPQAKPILLLLTAALLFAGQARWAWQELLLVAPAYDAQMHRRYARLEYARRHGQSEAVLAPLRLPAATSLLAPIPSARKRADVNIELGVDYRQKNNELLAHYYGLPRIHLSELPPPVQP